MSRGKPTTSDSTSLIKNDNEIFNSKKLAKLIRTSKPPPQQNKPNENIRK